MVFIAIAFLAVFLYIRSFKISALLLFFFFITSGFNLIPEEITKFAFISKGSDYAFLILVGVVFIDSFYNKGYFKRDNFTDYLIAFASFLVISMLYSKFIVKLGWGDILRTIRYQFFWVAYFLFRSMSKEKLEMLLKGLFLVSTFTAFLFLLQIVIDKNILIKTEVGYVRLFGMKISRFYNQPDMLFFFTFMALYHNPLKGIPKYASMIILTAALLGAFHRSLIGCFLISVIIGYAFGLPYLKRIYFTAISSILLLFIVIFLGNMFMHSRTYLDIQNVISGTFDPTEFNIDNLGGEEGTFTFRILHLLERNQYLIEHPKAMVLGAGLIPENSKLVDKMFDFKIGLVEQLTGAATQIETADISYSVLFLRLGYVGTFLYLSLIVYLMVFFYKKRENRYSLFSFLYLILAFGVSFFSANLLNPVTYLLPLISYHIIKKTNPEGQQKTVP